MITLKNNKASVTVDLNGGGIVDFHLTENDINPLTFRFAAEQMPENNRGACYQGHFACIGRWGQPSEGEIKAGHPNHGQAAMSQWEKLDEGDAFLKMKVNCPLDGLSTLHMLALSVSAPVFRVTETVKNINPLGRLYNVVQHPTLAAPFLDEATRVDCNATFGINYDFDTNPLEYASEWPQGMCKDHEPMSLNTPDVANSSVFSFIVDKESEFGWVTAYSPFHNLLLGYIWKRTEYPWISLWQHFENDRIKYRGIEFGTTGIHKPFNEILEHDNTRLFGEKTLWHIDAGEEVSCSYTAFLHQPEGEFTGVKNVSLQNGILAIKSLQGELIELETGLAFE
ncbi:hypothetical protein EOD41_08825 [Mucilaginibacter limnophilus]|uniref:DUF4432 family protein n=1 Tax=Mucilaginibacter limnophilus TaxID=1932778 RepID=A0A3S3TIV2_9SPHI|nr:hypothetical protein [Mucilaginibacter limnophilus]RVU02043.1 hypothetical protein EOD41_08825 [Mucilaginibacter limnophilus]